MVSRRCKCNEPHTPANSLIPSAPIFNMSDSNKKSEPQDLSKAAKAPTDADPEDTQKDVIVALDDSDISILKTYVWPALPKVTT